MTEAEYSEWLKSEPRIVKENKDGSKYVPISCVQEDLMEGFSGNTSFELIREIVVKSGLAGVGRLHYKSPITNEWLFQDGSASIPFRSGMRLDFPALGGHIMLNCAKKIGVRFGMYLNREQDDAPLPIIKVEKITPNIEQDRLSQLINQCETIEALETFKLLATTKKIEDVYDKKLKELANGNKH